MSTDNQLFHFRKFLNDGQGAAMVEARVTDNCSVNRNNGERSVSIDGELHITDCSRSIQLDTYFNDIDGARAALLKLDRLIDAVQGMRDAVVRAARREFPGRKL